MTKRDNFIFVDLQAQDIDGEAKPFDGLSVGTFTDMYGREAEFKPEEMASYAVNTAYALESTRDSGGNVVGFPIDAMNHDHREAAGWIVGVDLSEDGTRLRLTPRWNDYGKELIGGDLARFFSPTVDLKTKTVIGGSLTNWPATRTANHQILLRPVELASEMFTPDVPAVPAMIADLKQFITGLFSGAGSNAGGDEPPAKPKGDTDMTEPTNQVLPGAAELTAEQTAALELLVEQRAQARFQGWLEKEQRKADVLEYSKSVTGKGLPVHEDELTAFLSSLTAEQLEGAKALFSKIAETGPIDYGEHGHSKTLNGAQPLPDWAKSELHKWLDAGFELAGFFAANAAELGNQSDYNLTEFEPQGE